MNINERIRYLRKEILNLTQKEFAMLINISRSNMAGIELGRVNVTERVITDICEKVGVNKSWLTDGTGSWQLVIERETEIMDFAQSIAMPGDESFKKEFLHILSQLDEDDWETLEKIANLMVKEKS